MARPLRQQQSFVQTTFSGTEGGPIHTASEVGPIVSYLFADLAFDLTGPPPISFTTKNAEFQLRDSSGSYVGSLLANIVEGRGFLTSLPGAPMPILRGAALAPIRGGSGAFAEARGLVTVVNWISIFPRQVSGYFLVRLDDPTGRYREALQQASCATCTDFRLSPPWSSERS